MHLIQVRKASRSPLLTQEPFKKFLLASVFEAVKQVMDISSLYATYTGYTAHDQAETFSAPVQFYNKLLKSFCHTGPIRGAQVKL